MRGARFWLPLPAAALDPTSFQFGSEAHRAGVLSLAIHGSVSLRAPGMSTHWGPLSFPIRDVPFPVASHSLLAPKQPTGTPAQGGPGRGGFFFSLPWPVWGMAENGQKSAVPQELRLGTETGGGLWSKHCLGPMEGHLGKPRGGRGLWGGLEKEGSGPERSVGARGIEGAEGGRDPGGRTLREERPGPARPDGGRPAPRSLHRGVGERCPLEWQVG